MASIKFKKIIMLFSCIFSLSSCVNSETDNQIKITDCAGIEIKITKNPQRIISVNQSFVEFSIAMGEGSKIIGTHGSVLGHVYLPYFCPEILNATKVGYQANPELIFSLEPDLIVLNDPAYAQSLRDKGLPAIYFGYNNIDELNYSLNLMSDIYGGNAKKFVQKWMANFANTLENISNDLSSLTDLNKKNVYYINAAINPGDLYSTFGGNSFVEYWINHIGGKLVTSKYPDIDSIEKEVALSLNPETIFISGYAEYTRKDELFADPSWKNIDAVANNEVYLMPTSLVSYERFSVELPMLFEYSASILYPELHKFDGINSLRNFNKEIYNIEFSDAILNNMLLGLGPNGERMG
ncbi:MAG: ABC transporter substrate-binding protein [Bacilli bacterium]|nr:ABC transporter substrate-binding protein [Bacilli bacterium]